MSEDLLWFGRAEALRMLVTTLLVEKLKMSASAFGDAEIERQLRRYGVGPDVIEWFLGRRR